MENWLLRRALLTPERLALVEGSSSWTFRDLADAAVQRAGWIRERTASQRVAVLGATDAETVIWLLATLSAGKTAVLLNSRWTATEIEPALQRCAVELVLPRDAPSSWQEASTTSTSTLRTWEPDQPATIMFTSGTTGTPKAVVHSFGNHWASAIASALNLGLEDAPAPWICAVPLCHVSGLSMLMKGIIYGATLHLLPRFDPSVANDLLLSGKAGYMSVVPTMLSDLLDDLGERSYPTSVRALLVGGSAADPMLLQRAEDHGAPAIYCYGMTETSSQVLAFPRDRRREAPGASGLPLMSTQARIRDDRLEIRSPTVCVGFLDDAEGYAQRWTPDGWFRTGDLASIDESGFVTIHARSTELIVSGGENVYPGEVVAALRGFAGVRDAVVVGIPHERWGQVPAAAVCVDADATFDAAEIKAYCRRQLAAYKVPHVVEFMDAFPLTATGKPHLLEIQHMLTQIASGE